MPDEAIQQIISTLKSAKNIALLLPTEPTLDSVSAAMALRVAFTKSGTSAIIVCSAIEIPKLDFIDQAVSAATGFGSPDQFAVRISNANAKPGELRYETEADGVVIYLKAKEGKFLPTDVSVLPATDNYDAIISLGVSNLDQLGEVYTNNPNIFFETPIINIDNNPTNDYFGTINLVEVKASSICEIVFDIITTIPDVISNDIVSTSLLAGMISQTQSFRDQRTTPATLSKASQLVGYGARQQDIIQYLYKTKPFSTLQLWGRAMARLISMPEYSLLYTAVAKSDMEKTGASQAVLTEVLRDLVEMVSDYSVVALSAELPEGVRVFIAGLPHIKVKEVLQKMGASVTVAHHLAGKFEFAIAEFPDKNPTEIQNMLAEVLL